MMSIFSPAGGGRRKEETTSSIVIRQGRMMAHLHTHRVITPTVEGQNPVVFFKIRTF